VLKDQEIGENNPLIKKEPSDNIDFIRAVFNRSCAVTKKGKVFIWGIGFKL